MRWLERTKYVRYEIMYFNTVNCGVRAFIAVAAEAGHCVQVDKVGGDGEEEEERTACEATAEV